MRYYPFTYRKNNLHVVQLFFVGGLGLMLFVFGLLFLNASFTVTGDDNQLFLILMVAMMLPGIAIVWFSYFYFNRMRHFNSDQTTQYGVTINENSVYCLQFDGLKQREWKVDLSSITALRTRIYKGIWYIDFKIDRKLYFINTSLLTKADCDDLFYCLEQGKTPAVNDVEPTREDRMLQQIHLEIAAAYIASLEATMAFTIKKSWKKIDDSHYLFGFDEENPESVHLQLTIYGASSGDYYSGSTEFENWFKLINAYDRSRKNIGLNFIHTSTSLAGNCSYFETTNVSENNLLAFKSIFSELRNNTIQIPDYFPSVVS
ncbi:MAG: hypothetical protein QE487_05735 [Fluviicola sp.]|nr:hypothetical protein [Fluviicola sp.]